MRPAAPIGALIGLLTAGIAVGVGELVAALVRPAAAPVTAVGNRLILFTPESVKRATINSVGTGDKTVLLAGIYLLLAVLGAAIGVVAVRHLMAGLGGVVLLGSFGVYCALTANAGRPSDVIPTVIGTAAAMSLLVLLVRLARRTSPRHREGADLRQPDRRLLLEVGLGAAALAVLAGIGGRAAQQSRFDVAAKRRAFRLPPAAPPPSAEPSPAQPGPAQSSPAQPSLGEPSLGEPSPDRAATPAGDSGPDLKVSGVPWVTPNGSFYRIDTALTVPQVDPDAWTLRVHGMVEREITLTWRQLLARPMIERWITLCCVSNTVGGGLIGNALFQGTPLADLLREAGVQPAADQLLLTSIDGYSFGAPTAVVMDGRDALLAIGMNGEPLPIEHGFPVRTVVPGLYGYVSACKWVVDIEATTFARDQAYWVQGGWAPAPPIRLASRIDTPRGGQRVRVGRPVAIAGVAWDQHVGISAVEVQVGNGPWQPAQLATVPSTDTWRQWVARWTPETPGAHRLTVRATDALGRPQDPLIRAPFPSGASGLHSITVHAVA